MNDFYILLLGAAFSLTAKPIDLIDENKWIVGNVGFALKYFFVLLFSYVVFLSLEADRNLTPHFLALFLFWILRGKFGYPSHVLFAFIPGILIGQHITQEYVVMGVGGLAVYGVLEYVVRHFKNRVVQTLLYKSLGRFLIVPLGISLYLDDYNPLLYVIPGLLLMHLVRYLIRKDIIRIREGVRT
jgi:hypothetical protein